MSTNPSPPKVQVRCEGGWSRTTRGERSFDFHVVDANNGLTMFELEIPEDAMVDLLTNSRFGKLSTLKIVAGTKHVGDVTQVAHVTIKLDVAADKADTFPSPALLAKAGITFQVTYRSDRKDG